MFIAAFVAMFVTGVSLPPRYYYPNFNLADADRAVCNAKADEAWDEWMTHSSDVNFARIAEVDAFEACAKERQVKR
jgi:hypothetical protein